MPQIFMFIAPEAQGLFRENPVHKIDALGELLKDSTENIFKIKGKDDVAFDATFLFHTIGEKPIQIEVRYTVGKNEYGKGKPFNPSNWKKKKLANLIKKTVEEITKISPSVWVIPISNSVFLP